MPGEGEGEGERRRECWDEVDFVAFETLPFASRGFGGAGGDG